MKIKLILIIILLLGAFLRLYKLGSIPPHLTGDEAALGYSAYSILRTGRDEYGTFMPIIFKSFGDFKPGFYIYTAVPGIALLGLNEFSTRLPSALSGIMAIVLLYLIVQKLFASQKTSFFAALFIAISPWHIHFSRGAWEINVALTLTLAGIYFFLRALKERMYLFVSTIMFGLTFITYQGAKLSTSIVLILLFILWGKDLIKTKKIILIVSAILGLLIVSPIILSFFQAKTGRLAIFSIFSYRRPQEYVQNILDQGNERVGDVSYYSFHSENYNTFRGVLSRYFNHFSGRFLFFEGDWQNPRHSAPNHGALLLSDSILIIAALAFLCRYKIKREHLFIILWLLLAPLPAVLSRDQVHAVRSFTTVAPLMVLLAFGAANLNKKLLIGFTVFGIAAYIYFVDAYFIHLPKHSSKKLGVWL